MIREASIYALNKSSQEALSLYGLRVLTMRRWPQGVSRKMVNLWIPSAAPSASLLASWRAQQITWSSFLMHYVEEQKQQQHCRVVSYEHGGQRSHEYACRSIDYLARLERQHGIITVLCWEQSEHCHRFKLSELITMQTQRGTAQIAGLNQPVQYHLWNEEVSL